MKFKKFIEYCHSKIEERGTSLVVGVGGGECVGKTYLANQWKEISGEPDIIILPLDGYLNISRKERKKYSSTSSDPDTMARSIGDHPDFFDTEQLLSDLSDITQKGEWKKRHYDYSAGEVVIDDSVTQARTKSLIIVEGLFALHKSLRDHIDIKVYVLADEHLRRMRYLERHEKRKEKTAYEIIDIFDRVVLATEKSFILPTAKHAEYIILNNDSNPVARKMEFGAEKEDRKAIPLSTSGTYGIFITHNLDKMTGFIMKIIERVAQSEGVHVIKSSSGGAAVSPAKDVRAKIAQAEALLAVVGRDTNWVSNEIGMAYALHLPVYVIHAHDSSISGVVKMITSIKSADIYKPDELEKHCGNAIKTLKSEIDYQRAKLPEMPHPGSTVVRIGWEKYYNLIKTAHKKINLDPDPIQQGYAPTILLGISRGGIIAADILSRLSADLPLGILEAKRREISGRVYFEEEQLGSCLKEHCKKESREVRILVVDDVFKSGTSLKSALRTTERLMCMIGTKKMQTFSIRSLVLFLQGSAANKGYVPDYFMEEVEDGTSLILPYGRG